MPEYLAPGVYVEEVPSGNKPIEGVSTSTAGMVGVTERGPVNEPTLVTSSGQFTRMFGGYLDHRVFTEHRDHLPYAVEGFFANGGQRVYINRVVGEEAKTATIALSEAPQQGAVETTLAQTTAAAATELALADASAIAEGDKLFISDGTRSEYVDVSGAPTGNTVPIAETPTKFLHVADVEVHKHVPLLRVHARHPGQWGNRLRINVKKSSILDAEVAAAAAEGVSPVKLDVSLGLAEGSVLAVLRTEEGQEEPTEILRQRVTGVSTNDNEADIEGGLAAAVQVGDQATSVEFDLFIQRLDEDGNEAESEAFINLGMDPKHPRYAPKIVGAFDRAKNEPGKGGESELIRLSDLTLDDTGADVPDADAMRLTLPHEGVNLFLDDGDDDVANIDDAAYIGEAAVDPEDRTGIHALESIDQIGIVAVPGRTSQDVQNALINHCRKMRYCFAVLDSEPKAKLKAVQKQRQRYDTTRAALYYPWLVIGDRFGRNGDTRDIPASGHVVGIYARSDTQRGVHKAPANEVVRGIRDLQARLTKGEHDILNPQGIDVIRDFRDLGRGLRVWGARTLSSDPEWKYVNVRRLFLFVEKSIERGTQFAVFEPNAEPLWATIQRSVSNFLTAVWRDGALEGTSVEEAFFVKVDRTTMTQNDIDNGRLIILVGIAPVKPAEFVIFRISQKTREATA